MGVGRIGGAWGVGFWAAGMLAAVLWSGTGLAGGGGGGPTVVSPTVVSPDPVRSVAAGTDGRGNFVVAWVAQRASLTPGHLTSGHEQLHAARRTGGVWRALGGVINEQPSFNAAQPNVHPGPNGSVWLAWEEGSGLAHIDSFLMSNWTGAHWTAPGPYALRRNLSDAGRSRSFAADPHNQPLVAWTDISTRQGYPSVVSLKLWQGQSWFTTPYLNLNVQTPAFMPSVAQVNGWPSVAYVEGAATQSDLWVRRWNGGAWTTLGERVNLHPKTYIFKPILRADALGRLTVAWLEDAGGLDALYVSRWTGQRWERLGGLVSQAGELAASASLAFDAHQRPVVAWTQGPDGQRQVYAARWETGQWRRLGGGALNANPRNDTDHSSIAASAQGILVAWRELVAGQWRVHTRLFP